MRRTELVAGLPGCNRRARALTLIRLLHRQVGIDRPLIGRRVAWSAIGVLAVGAANGLADARLLAVILGGYQQETRMQGVLGLARLGGHRTGQA